MHSIGIDVGSTYTKYCITDENKNIIELFKEKSPIRQKEYFQKKYDEFCTTYLGPKIVSCGYGRKNIEAVKNVNDVIAPRLVGMLVDDQVAIDKMLIEHVEIVCNSISKAC